MQILAASSSGPVAPATAPTSLALVSKTTTTVILSFTAPTDDGGLAITNYEFSADGGTTWYALSPADATSPVTISGLGAGNSYAFFLRAVNAIGSGPSSATSVTVTTLNPPSSVEYVSVAGGGAAIDVFRYQIVGGGGAGGYLSGTASIGSSFTVTVGAGGAANSNGSNSVFGSLTSVGGGLGNYSAGSTGGSGGGTGTQPPYTGGAGTSGQGNAGGNTSASQNAASGGGGASAAGANNPSFSVGGAGGAGTASSITGSSVTRAGGGGGGTKSGTPGAGGAGGGGAGGNAPGGGTSVGNNATSNTGGGAGGGANDTGADIGGATGGSGVVILAYASTFDALTTIGGGLTYSVDTSSRSGYRVYTFTAGTGTVTV
jgi:hypothetical protein